jgi:hypothetical protein
MLDGFFEGLLSAAANLTNRWHPIDRPRSPVWASVIGALFGGIGLAIYFRSILDFIVPFAIMVAVVAAVTALDLGTPIGWLTVVLLWARYGYFRASRSNALLEAEA